MDGPVRNSIKRKYNLFKRFLHTKNNSDFKKYIEARNSTTKVIRNAKKMYEEKIASESKSNPKHSGVILTPLENVKDNITVLSKEDGSVLE